MLRILSEEKNRHDLDAVVSALKLRGSAMQQRVTELQVEALGPHALRHWGHDEGEAIGGDEALRWPPHVPGRTAQALITRASTIYGGSQEIQKNIIAKLAFGLWQRSGTQHGLQPDEEQQMLRDAVEPLRARAVRLRGAAPAVEAAGSASTHWAQYAEMGWLGLGIPEAFGGLGCTFVETALVVEEFGRALVLEPYIGCAVLAARLVETADAPVFTAHRRGELLEAIAGGALQIALAHSEPAGRYELDAASTTARAEGKGFVIEGTKLLIPGAPAADLFIVSAQVADERARAVPGRQERGRAARLSDDRRHAGRRPGAALRSSWPPTRGSRPPARPLQSSKKRSTAPRSRRWPRRWAAWKRCSKRAAST